VPEKRYYLETIERFKIENPASVPNVLFMMMIPFRVYRTVGVVLTVRYRAAQLSDFKNEH
jgi:hypothetical protein